MTTSDNGGLRQRKKVATRDALSSAALRLALEHGPGNVRVDDIAAAAGVSTRTYNNYFSSREEAMVAAITAQRASRIGAALRARPVGEPLAEAVIEVVVEQYVAVGEPDRDVLALLTSAPGLRAAFVGTAHSIEQSLAAAIEARTGHADPVGAAVLAAAVSAAARVATERWLRRQPDAQPHQLLVVTGGPPLTDVLRETLAHLAPALRAADPGMTARNSVPQRT